jgi:excinuclease ABC subunit A
VGLPYLSLSRAAPTLSGGEAQRIRLAAQLGSNLRGVCYILDEPTIGLHPRDNGRLLALLDRLRAKGNTVIVVEHDEETIRRSQHLVDLGPGGGVNGGRLVAEGTVEDVVNNAASITGKFLRDPLRHPISRTPGRDAPKPGQEEPTDAELVVEASPQHLEIVGADLHNLKNLRIVVPLGRLVCVTGVSGSGKSTLAQEILFANLRKLLSRRGPKRSVEPRGCREIRGWEALGRVLEVDQTPIGKTPRSCPATYVGFWSEIRRLFAGLPEARMRGYAPARFSFNVSGGRCETCAGQGLRKIKMSFLPDVSVVCDVCGGMRFTQETLTIRYRGKSIAEVLAMSVDEAKDFFVSHPKIHRSLSLLQEVGLGYLTLGQRSPTLSGGEAQRIKLVTELAKTGAPPYAIKGRFRSRRGVSSLYILDEPTIGLHMADVERLLHVLHGLVEAGNTVVIVEHNLDIIAEADWIIDLGPEGGDEGGAIVAEGNPRQVAAVTRGSYTATYLSDFLSRRGTRED